MSTSTAPPTQPSIQPSQPITDSTTPESQSKPEESPQIPSPFPVLTKYKYISNQIKDIKISTFPQYTL